MSVIGKPNAGIIAVKVDNKTSNLNIGPLICINNDIYVYESKLKFIYFVLIDHFTKLNLTGDYTSIHISNGLSQSVMATVQSNIPLLKSLFLIFLKSAAIQKTYDKMLSSIKIPK